MKHLENKSIDKIIGGVGLNNSNLSIYMQDMEVRSGLSIEMSYCCQLSALSIRFNTLFGVINISPETISTMGKIYSIGKIMNSETEEGKIFGLEVADAIKKEYLELDEKELREELLNQEIEKERFFDLDLYSFSIDNIVEKITDCLEKKIPGTTYASTMAPFFAIAIHTGLDGGGHKDNCYGFTMELDVVSIIEAQGSTGGSEISITIFINRKTLEEFVSFLQHVKQARGRDD